MNPHKAESSICNLVELGNLKKTGKEISLRIFGSKGRRQKSAGSR